jgi:pimeloyl-ACP methyl ester carboxylesterase
MSDSTAVSSVPSTPISLHVLRGAMRLLSRTAPGVASRVAADLFMKPRRYRTPERERKLMADAKAFDVRIGDSMVVKAWRWGTGEQIVILAHGWEGRGSQMAAFAAPLVAAGYSVVTFDAPGHGASTGNRSSLPHFTWALRGVADATAAPHAVIAHSLGCAATTLALRDGFDVQRLVFLAPPLNPADYTEQFGEILGLDGRTIEGLRHRIEERFLRKWSDYSLAATARSMSAPLLVIHDRNDTETSWAGGAALAEVWPGARMMTTEGLGHRRILREAAVIDAATKFVVSA